VGQSTVDCSNGTIFEMFYVVICITVHTNFSNFFASVRFYHSFGLGPKVKAIKLRFDFSFGLVCLSQVF